MITLRRAAERHHVRRHRQDVWLTFKPQDEVDALAGDFGALAMLGEARLPPGARARLPSRSDEEVVTYVHEGALAQKGPAGSSGIVHAGEFQCMSAGHVGHGAANSSRVNWTHIFQIGLRPTSAEPEPSHEQRRYSAAERSGALCLVASPDGRKKSLRLHEDVLIFSALIDTGQHLVYELTPERSAWLHIVSGEAGLFDEVLVAGDGVGFTAERAVSLTGRKETELLLFDLREEPPKSNDNEGAT